MTRGFTLIEVVVALVILELAVVGVLGTLVTAAEVWREAEQVERDVGQLASVFDSLRGVDSVWSDSTRYPGGMARWTVSAGGVLAIEVNSREASLGVTVHGSVP